MSCHSIHVTTFKEGTRCVSGKSSVLWWDFELKILKTSSCFPYLPLKAWSLLVFYLLCISLLFLGRWVVLVRFLYALLLKLVTVSWPSSFVYESTVAAGVFLFRIKAEVLFIMAEGLIWFLRKPGLKKQREAWDFSGPWGKWSGDEWSSSAGWNLEWMAGRVWDPL